MLQEANGTQVKTIRSSAASGTQVIIIFSREKRGKCKADQYKITKKKLTKQSFETPEGQKRMNIIKLEVHT